MGIYIYFIKIICLWLIPKKRNKNKNHIPKERKKLLNRIKMLKRKKHSTKNRNKEKSIENDILETEIKLKEHRDQEKYTMEKKERQKERKKQRNKETKKQRNKETKKERKKRKKDEKRE